MTPLDSLWERVQKHPAFRAGAVYAAVSWVLIQAAEVFGLPTGAIRIAGALLGVGFALLVAGALLLPRAAETGAAARSLLPSGRRLWATVTVLLVLGTGAWWAAPRVLRGTVAPGADLIAVLPFSASGPGVADFGEGMVDLLSTSLDQVGGVRTVHPRTVLHRWGQRAVGGTLDLEGSVRLAQELEAGSILLGSITGTGTQAVLTAELYSSGGERLAQASTTGSSDSILSLVDDLSVRLLREIWRSSRPIPQLRVSGITTSSMEALRAYLAGERHYRAARWDSAAVAFEQAVAADSLFALAHLRLAESYGWSRSHGDRDAVREAEISVRLADRLPERERTLARIHLMHERGEFAGLDTAEAFVRRYPDDAMGWYLLGDIRFHARGVMPLPDSALLAPFDRLMELDPTLALGLVHPIEHALLVGDSARYDRLLARYAAIAPDDEAEGRRRLREVRFGPPDSIIARYTGILRWIQAEAQGREPAWLNRWLGRSNGAAGPVMFQEPAADPDALLLALDTARTLLDLPAFGWHIQRAVFQLGLGRIESARAHLDSVAITNEEAAWGNGLYAVLIGTAPEELMRRYASRLDDERQAAYGYRMAALARGDLSAARAIEPPPFDSATLARTPQIPAMLRALDGWELLVAGDTAAAFEVLESSLRGVGYLSSNTGGLFPILFEYAVAQSRRPGSRSEGILRLQVFTSHPLYVVPAWLALAEAREAAGDRAAAAEAYGHVVRLWEKADPHLQPTVDAARRALARLASEG